MSKTTGAAWVAGLALITAATTGGKPIAEMIIGVVAGIAVIALGTFARDDKPTDPPVPPAAP